MQLYISFSYQFVFFAAVEGGRGCLVSEFSVCVCCVCAWRTANPFLLFALMWLTINLYRITIFLIFFSFILVFRRRTTHVSRFFSSVCYIHIVIIESIAFYIQKRSTIDDDAETETIIVIIAYTYSFFCFCCWTLFLIPFNSPKVCGFPYAQWIDSLLVRFNDIDDDDSDCVEGVRVYFSFGCVCMCMPCASVCVGVLCVTRARMSDDGSFIAR